MNNTELILRLMEVKAAHYWGCSFTYAQANNEELYEGTPPIAREELYDAKCEALREFVAELRKHLTTRPVEPHRREGERDQRYAFITQMAGTMTASIFNTYEEVEAAENRFQKDHEEYLEHDANAKSAWNVVLVGERRAIPGTGSLSNGLLDVRLVLITEVDDHLHAIICDTQDDLRREIKEFEREYENWIDSQAAFHSSHEVLIPPRQD